MASERLQKLIARAGLASRRGAEQLIADGRVSVNGALASLGDSADAGRDRIEVDGRPMGAAAPAIHLAIHKPRGFLSSARDERGRRSVVSLVDTGERLWPAGRLDVESEGLMILTNDGLLSAGACTQPARFLARLTRQRLERSQAVEHLAGQVAQFSHQRVSS